MSYLGLDIGSSSIKAVYTGNGPKPIILKSDYLRNMGIVSSLQKLILKFQDIEVAGMGITGSGRDFGNTLLCTDLVKNEITAHAVAAQNYLPSVRTVFELGGEDIKIIMLEDGIVIDFEMNSACAAGSGSIIEAIAARMGVAIEEVGDLALSSKNSITIASKCGVFSTSTAINKRNMGVATNDIMMGVCRAIVNGYFSVLVRNRVLKGPYVLQGMVAHNKAIVKCFQDMVNDDVLVPEHPELMGAVGMSLLLQEAQVNNPRSIDMNHNYETKVRIGTNCGNKCEIIDIIKDDKVLGYIGNRCGKCVAQTKVPGPLCQIG